MGQPAYIGDDGRAYRDPCTSRRGKLKQRWPSSNTAWYVAELVALGMHKVRGQREKMLPYHCPKCDGYHLKKCRTPSEQREHDVGLAEWKKTRK